MPNYTMPCVKGTFVLTGSPTMTVGNKLKSVDVSRNRRNYPNSPYKRLSHRSKFWKSRWWRR